METKLTLKSLSKQLKESIDLFICSASFEDRCFSVAQNISKSAKKTKKIVIFYNTNEYNQIIINSGKLFDLFGNRAQKIDLQSDNPISNVSKIIKYFSEFFSTNKKPKNILLDSTTFTHETLLIIIRILLFNKESINNIFITYVSAECYSFNESKPENKWLSAGIKQIRSVVGYPGQLSPARDYHLIILFGFESERTKKLIEEYEFSRISIAFGNRNESINDEHRELNHTRHKDLLSQYPIAEDFDISLTDPISAKNKILEQSLKFSNYNTIVAPMNNKISTIGAALAAVENPKIQLIYAQPITYNYTSYSKPKDECYLFSILHPNT
nr:hypothetical protein [uncultured Arsenicibacter sp.]